MKRSTFLRVLGLTPMGCLLGIGADSFWKGMGVMPMSILNPEQVQTRLGSLEGWELKEASIRRVFKFSNFVDAIAFVNRIVEPAESANHHPDLEVSYGKVVVSLTTHDAGGLTEKDFDLAQAITAAL